MLVNSDIVDMLQGCQNILATGDNMCWWLLVQLLLRKCIPILLKIFWTTLQGLRVHYGNNDVIMGSTRIELEGFSRALDG